MISLSQSWKLYLLLTELAFQPPLLLRRVITSSGQRHLKICVLEGFPSFSSSWDDGMRSDTWSCGSHFVIMKKQDDHGKSTHLR